MLFLTLTSINSILGFEANLNNWSRAESTSIEICYKIQISKTNREKVVLIKCDIYEPILQNDAIVIDPKTNINFTRYMNWASL